MYCGLNNLAYICIMYICRTYQHIMVNKVIKYLFRVYLGVWGWALPYTHIASQGSPQNNITSYPASTGAQETMHRPDQHINTFIAYMDRQLKYLYALWSGSHAIQLGEIRPAPRPPAPLWRIERVGDGDDPRKIWDQNIRFSNTPVNTLIRMI